MMAFQIQFSEMYDDECLIHFQVMCPHFVSAISETIGDKWSQELESAYNHLFSILSFHMRTSLMIEHHKTAISEKKKERQKK